MLINWFSGFCLLNVILFVIMWSTGILKASDDGMSKTIVITIFVQGAISVLVFLFDLQLILFHVWIADKGITTFEYIGFKREEAMKKE